VASEFARPNICDMDIALAKETLQVQATSPAPSSSPHLSSTASASSMDTNQTLNPAASAAVMQAGKLTPHR
jgi:hypothetical protein